MRYDRGHHALQIRHEDPDTGQAVAYSGAGNVVPLPNRLDRLAQMDAALCRHIAPLLDELYPGHPWFVGVEHEQGIIKINLPALMKQNYFVIHIATVQTNPFELKRKIKQGCGEILERYQLPRSGYSHAEYLSALEARPLWKMRNDTLLPA